MTETTETTGTPARPGETATLEELDRLADLLDSRFVIPGTRLRFGLDSLLGLIPGVGDTLTLLLSVYILGKAGRYNLPLHIKARMLWNVFIDWLIGLIPFVGDIFDFGWKANRRNIRLLKNYVTKDS